jgi:cell division protein ZapA
MACGDGEEAHLEGLAAELDGKINELRGSFGEIGDQRLIVMSAITVLDERAELLSRIARLEKQVAQLRQTTDAAENQQESWAQEVARALDEMATRIERVAQGLNGKA